MYVITHVCNVMCQVAATLGRKYEDQVANIEPDMPTWAESLYREFGHDATDGGEAVCVGQSCAVSHINASTCVW